MTACKNGFENIREPFTIPNAALFSFPDKRGAHPLTLLSLDMSLITVAVQQSEQRSCTMH